MVVDDQRFWGKSLSIHLFRYRQLQSEIHDFLYQERWPADPPLDLDLWQTQMHGRISEWYDDTPRGHNLTETERTDIENFELSLQRALLYLYKPSPNIPNPPETALVALSECAAQMVQLYRKLFRGYRLTIYWQAVENLSSAGTSLLFSYVNSAAVRRRITFQSLESLIHTCSSVLWGMVEHFPAFKGKRDAFDLLASKTLTDIASSPIVTGSYSGLSHAPRHAMLSNLDGGHDFSIIRQEGEQQEQQQVQRQLDEYRQQGASLSRISHVPESVATEISFSEVGSHLASQGPPFLGMVDKEPNEQGQSTATMLSDVEYFDWEAMRGTNEYFAADWI